MKEMIYTDKNKRELLYNNIFLGFHYYILNLGTHPTAYVEIPKSHKYFEKGYNDIDIDCHGGLTYSKESLKISDNVILDNSWFIGWDYAHAGDYYGYDIKWKGTDLDSEDNKKWTLFEIIEECKEVIKQLNEEE